MRTMLRLGAAVLVTMVLVSCQSENAMTIADRDGWNHYGFENRTAGPEVSLGALKGGESNVVTRGTIVEVCKKKGCWMKVRAGDEDHFVRFQDYAFFVPRNAAGHEVVMHGTAVRQETSVEELRHYAEDAGKSAAEIAAITESEMTVTFFADSVYIAGDGLEPPHVQ